MYGGKKMNLKESPLFQVMALNEAATLYNVNLETLKSRFKGTTEEKQMKIKRWEELGLARKSGNTWLVTKDFMEIEYGYQKGKQNLKGD